MNVKCTIKKCRYNQEGDKCNATSIEVVPNCTTNDCCNSKDTKCKTFISK